jgi:hypothetical protein
MGTRVMARRTDKLRLVNQRLNKFYGPLYVATIAGNIAYRSSAAQLRAALPRPPLPPPRAGVTAASERQKRKCNAGLRADNYARTGSPRFFHRRSEASD